MSTSELVRAKREQILRAATSHGAKNVRIFGSVARREDQPDSDVDFLVDMEAGRSLLDLGGLLVDLEQLLGRRVDVITEQGLRSRIRARVLAEAQPL
jgi:predicted nucleotidyltransferase